MLRGRFLVHLGLLRDIQPLTRVTNMEWYQFFIAYFTWAFFNERWYRYQKKLNEKNYKLNEDQCKMYKESMEKR